MLKRFYLFFFISFLFFHQIIAQENPIVRFPSLNPDGTKISFSYQGDIWTKGD